MVSILIMIFEEVVKYLYSYERVRLQTVKQLCNCLTGPLVYYSTHLFMVQCHLMAQISSDLWSRFHRVTTLNQKNHHVSYCILYVQIKLLFIEMLADINFLEFGHVFQIPVLLIFLLVFNELAHYIVSVLFPMSLVDNFLWFIAYCHCTNVIRAPVFHLVRAKSHFNSHVHGIFVTPAEIVYEN